VSAAIEVDAVNEAMESSPAARTTFFWDSDYWRFEGDANAFYRLRARRP
jgi:hypothetical protein